MFAESTGNLLVTHLAVRKQQDRTSFSVLGTVSFEQASWARGFV